MEANPYAAPGAAVDDAGAFAGEDLESRKASRGARLGAAMIDAVAALLLVVPLVLASMRPGANSAKHGLLLLLGLLVLATINAVLLHRNAQTIGKRLVGIKVVRTDGSRIGLGRIFLLRFLPVGLIGAIPVVGRFFSLVDAGFIFGNERRCLHDLIADTIVIRVD